MSALGCVAPTVDTSRHGLPCTTGIGRLLGNAHRQWTPDLPNPIASLIMLRRDVDPFNAVPDRCDRR